MESNSITLSLDFCPQLSLISILCLSVFSPQPVPLPPALRLALSNRGDLEQTLRKEVVLSKCRRFKALYEREKGKSIFTNLSDDDFGSLSVCV